MKKILLLLSLFFFSCGSNNSTAEKKSNKSLIIPAYFYDVNLWNRLVSSKRSFIVIVNPNNGPGSSIDENYKNFISNLSKTSKIPIGYVYTKFSKRDLNEVKKDITTWLEFYPHIKGFFIDESSNLQKDLKYYKDLVSFIKQKGSYFIVLNPGTLTYQSYFDLADLIVTYEGKNPSNKFCKFKKSAIIVYGADFDKLKEILKYNCRYFYVTDDDLPNPYDSLPTYFEEEEKLK